LTPRQKATLKYQQKNAEKIKDYAKNYRQKKREEENQ